MALCWSCHLKEVPFVRSLFRFRKKRNNAPLVIVVGKRHAAGDSFSAKFRGNSESILVRCSGHKDEELIPRSGKDVGTAYAAPYLCSNHTNKLINLFLIEKFFIILRPYLQINNGKKSTHMGHLFPLFFHLRKKTLTVVCSCKKISVLNQIKNVLRSEPCQVKKDPQKVHKILLSSIDIFAALYHKK